MSTDTATPNWDLAQVFNEALELFKKEAPLLLAGGAVFWAICTVIPFFTYGIGMWTLTGEGIFPGLEWE